MTRPEMWLIESLKALILRIKKQTNKKNTLYTMPFSKRMTEASPISFQTSKQSFPDKM